MTEQNLDVFDVFSENYTKLKQEAMSLRDYLLAARDDDMLYASPAERMVKAIGEPTLVDTSKDPRLARIFSNRTIRHYQAFEGFYGMEDTIERIVSFFRHAAQGLEEKRQIIYLLGPVGGVAQVARRRQGRHIYYSLADSHVIELVRNALDHAEHHPPNHGTIP